MRASRRDRTRRGAPGLCSLLHRKCSRVLSQAITPEIFAERERGTLFSFVCAVRVPRCATGRSASVGDASATPDARRRARHRSRFSDMSVTKLRARYYTLCTDKQGPFVPHNLIPVACRWDVTNRIECASAPPSLCPLRVPAMVPTRLHNYLAVSQISSRVRLLDLRPLRSTRRRSQRGSPSAGSPLSLSLRARAPSAVRGPL